MATSAKVIERAYRLINVPGLGGTLQKNQIEHGFDALKDILSMEAVSEGGQAGTVRQFFQLTSGKNVYSYGPGGDFDIEADFDISTPPIGVVNAAIYSGATITSNEKVSSPKFQISSDWTITGAAWSISNGVARTNNFTNSELSQSITVEPGKTYNLYIAATLYTSISSIPRIRIYETGNSGNRFLDVSLGTFNGFDAEFSPDVADITVEIRVQSITVNVEVTEISVIEKDAQLSQISLSDSKKLLKEMTSSNSMRTHSSSTRNVYRFNPLHPRPEIEIYSEFSSDDVLVMDVLLDTVSPTDVTKELNVSRQVEAYLVYELADQLAGSLGKTLTRSQLKTLEKYQNYMYSRNAELDELKSDPGLNSISGSSYFDINGG
jgi:hypothetical protein